MLDAHNRNNPHGLRSAHYQALCEEMIVRPSLLKSPFISAPQGGWGQKRKIICLKKNSSYNKSTSPLVYIINSVVILACGAGFFYCVRRGRVYDETTQQQFCPSTLTMALAVKLSLPGLMYCCQSVRLWPSFMMCVCGGGSKSVLFVQSMSCVKSLIMFLFLYKWEWIDVLNPEKWKVPAG